MARGHDRVEAAMEGGHGGMGHGPSPSRASTAAPLPCDWRSALACSAAKTRASRRGRAVSRARPRAACERSGRRGHWAHSSVSEPLSWLHHMARAQCSVSDAAAGLSSRALCPGSTSHRTPERAGSWIPATGAGMKTVRAIGVMILRRHCGGRIDAGPVVSILQ
jgi:hypothetical protein